MKRLPTILFTITLICLLCTGARSGYAEEIRGVTEDTVKIGLLADQTGLAASVTVPMTEAARVYFRNINDMGGISGRKIVTILEDDRYSIPGAIAAFKKLIFKDKVFAILFNGGLGQTLALERQIEKLKVPVIPLTIADKLTTPLRKYVFTMSASYDDGLKIIIDYIMGDLKAKHPKISHVYPDIEFGKSGVETVERYLPKYNLKLVSKEIVAVPDIDATSQVLRSIKTNPDYIIFNSAAAGCIAFLKGAKKYGLKSKIIGGFYLSTEDIISSCGDAAKDLLAVSPFCYWYDDSPGMVELRKITMKYQPQTKSKTRSYTQGWIVSLIFAEGLKRSGRNLTPDTLVEALESFDKFSSGGISTPVSYSKTNHKGGRGFKIYKADLERETYVPITDYRDPAFQD
ncbi:MAG: ABC transporter substrate-binding protein [Thermodesulfobacteriota bacterium]